MKKTLSLVGILVGIAVIMLGIVTIGDNLSEASLFGPSSLRNTPFHGLPTNLEEIAAREKTGRILAAADDVRILQNCFGCFEICVGVLACCGFGIVFAGRKNKEKATEDGNV